MQRGNGSGRGLNNYNQKIDSLSFNNEPYDSGKDIPYYHYDNQFKQPGNFFDNPFAPFPPNQKQKIGKEQQNDFKKSLDMMNSIVPKKIRKTVNDDENEHSMTNSFFIDKKQERNEEPDEGKRSTSSKRSNWVIQSFIPQKRKNELDDLRELLVKSGKEKRARKSVKNGKYTDKEFPPHTTSILGFNEHKGYKNIDLQKLVWMRPENFFKGDIRVYKSIEPDDIIQGGLGDCYLLAALSSIAANPERLERIFLTKNYSKEGIYIVALCINGIWEDVLIDDYFPCRPDNRKPAFNSSKKNELWVMLVEKAWAKVHGGYMNIAAGLTREALRDLTGAPAKTFFMEDGREGLWKIIHQAFDRKFVMTAGSDNFDYGRDTFMPKIGIAGSHAYSLLEVYEIDKLTKKIIPYKQRKVIPDKNKDKIVKLRNPWAKGEWNGDWSDNSSKWTPELRQILGIGRKDDGVFFMDYANFSKYFIDVQICYFHDKYKYSSIVAQSEDKERVYFRFVIKKAGEYYFSINQKNRRFFSKAYEYSYSPISLFMGYVDLKKNFIHVGNGIKEDKENWIAYKCQPGVYYAFVMTPWKSVVNEFSFSVYGPSVVKIEKLSRIDEIQSAFERFLISHSQTSKGEWIQHSNTSIFYKRFDEKSGLGYLHFKNKHTKHIANITVEFIRQKNMRFCEPFQGLSASVKIKPGKHRIIAYEPLGYPSSCEMKILFKLSQISKVDNMAVKKDGVKLIKKKNGKDIGINCYIVKGEDFVAFQYINKHKAYYLFEKLILKLEGCYIEGENGNILEVIVKPNSEKTYFVNKKKGANRFDLAVVKLEYNVLEIK